ncbi:MAG: enoyl-CoA hydratase/isomerase family protein [Proteobacteria bacterium]|nr:enoyl-CoA hydratase/isomerase family protein [Pseudomonadota bacterium]
METETQGADAAAGVHVLRDGCVGRLKLDRQKALNALDLPMIRVLRGALEDWRDDDAITAVVIEGEGRAFCAGGDIRAVRSHVLAGDHAEAERFFAEEYALNAVIARYPKPYVSLIGGLCMGGGLGISAHGSDRVVTEAAIMAMPETAIGLAPDIGATYFLPRLPGFLGTYMGLCGYRLQGADAVHAALATAFVPAARLPALSAALASEGSAAVARFTGPLPPYTLVPDLAAIDRCFCADSMPEIVARLEAEATPWSEAVLKVLRTMSPSSLCWSLAAIRSGAHRTLEECLAAELALVTRIIRMPDFAEGVRAMVVDKDRAPRWQPPRIEDVDPRLIADLLQTGH